MKKPNQIGGNGDSKRHRAQSQKAPQKSVGELSKINLASLLKGDIQRALFKWAGEGLPLAAQISGALESWVAFAEHQSQYSDGLRRIKEAPGILCAEQFECSIAKARGSFISAPTAEFFRSLLARARQMPLAEAMGYLSRLADLIEFHPGLADEFKALHALLDAECVLGRSEAVKAILDQSR